MIHMIGDGTTIVVESENEGEIVDPHRQKKVEVDGDDKKSCNCKQQLDMYEMFSSERTGSHREADSRRSFVDV